MGPTLGQFLLNGLISPFQVLFFLISRPLPEKPKGTATEIFRGPQYSFLLNSIPTLPHTLFSNKKCLVQLCKSNPNCGGLGNPSHCCELPTISLLSSRRDSLLFLLSLSSLMLLINYVCAIRN